MVLSGVLRKLFAKYKAIESVFFRADKKEDRTGYINLKYQFRMTLAFALLSLGISLSQLLLHGVIMLGPYPLLMSIMIGFRFKWYHLPRTMVLITMSMIPVSDLDTDVFLSVPTGILYTNVLMLILTQSELYTLAHLVIQTLFMYFYGVEEITQRIKSLTPEEIAKLAQAAVYLCLLGCWAGLVMMQRFYAHVSNLLRKIKALSDDISKVNNQLNDQNAKLQNNLEMKDVFIYTFSHELKNALNGLLGNLYLAYDIAKDPQTIQFLSSAKVCGEVLKNFVHNILDTGKLENGNLEVAPERRDVMSFMENVWQICGRIIENKRLQGYLEIAKNVPRYLDLDEQRMIQIILNLVSNACKFTERGHVRIQVSWERTSTSGTQIGAREGSVTPARSSIQNIVVEQEEEPNFFESMREYRDTSENLLNKERLHLVSARQKKFINDSQCYQLTLSKWNWNRDEVLQSDFVRETKGILKIQVLDTGCGMTEEDQAMLFRKFSQTNRIAGQRKVGTGLGLWICKELSHRLDGDIKIRSLVGVGSVFELAITTTVSYFAEIPYHRPTSSLESDISPLRDMLRRKQPNTKKILIADDDCFNVELMKNYLNKFGIGYICAYDGEETVSLFKKHYQDICYVITDNFMPKKTGTEAAGEITQFLKQMKKPKIPIMCISGDVKVHVGEAGITSVIQKPINFDRLKEELMIYYPQLENNKVTALL